VTIITSEGLRSTGEEVAEVREKEETTKESESPFIALENKVNSPEYIRG
jgi:hypothetical protein